MLFLLGRYFEQRSEATQRINKEKIEIYRTFFDFYFDLMSYEKIHGEPKDTKLIMSEMLEFQKQILFWSSDKVIKDYLDFKDTMIGFSDEFSEDNNEKLRLAIGGRSSSSLVLVSMRRSSRHPLTSAATAFPFTASNRSRNKKDD